MKECRIRAGVVSDTHLAGGQGDFTDLVNRYFSECDFVLHAGDITDPDILEGTGKEIIAVRGNMDETGLYPLKRILNICSKKIGMIHGYGPREGIEERIRKEFEDVDCIVYGHTHFPFSATIDGVYFFNPGSCFDRRFAPHCTLGYLNITDEAVTGEIIEIKDN